MLQLLISYRIAGTFEEENFREFRDFVAIHESFSAKFRHVALLALQKRAIRESFFRSNRIFHQFARKFFPSKVFPAIQYPFTPNAHAQIQWMDGCSQEDRAPVVV